MILGSSSWVGRLRVATTIGVVPGQNIYDDEEFFNRYQAMRNAGSGLNEAVEQPALRFFLPTVVDLDVIDLGCGDGSLCRELADAGARTVLGVDPSERMLRLAVDRSAHPRVRFVQVFAEDLHLSPSCADLVVSSLALHYVDDLASLFIQIGTWLRPGGTLVASMEHPVVTAAPGQACEHGWIVRAYAQEGARRTSWNVDNVLKYHRTTATIMTSLIEAGLILTGFAEPGPTSSALAARPDLDIHTQRPPLLVIRAQKPAAGS